jgi:hypothetical protein
VPIGFFSSRHAQAEGKGDVIMSTLRVLAAVALVLTIMSIAVLAVLGRAMVRGVQWAGTPVHLLVQGDGQAIPDERRSRPRPLRH